MRLCTYAPSREGLQFNEHVSLVGLSRRHSSRLETLENEYNMHETDTSGGVLYIQDA